MENPPRPREPARRALGRLRRVAAAALRALLAPLVGLQLRLDRRDGPARTLLAAWRAERRDASPGDRREPLRRWFGVQRAAEREINRLCNEHYGGRHPKHFLWRGHNQFLVDNVRDGDHVLDVGCGSSAYPQWLAQRAATVTCVDVRAERIEEARRRNRLPNVRFERLDVAREVPRGRFDVAICSHVIEHLDDPVGVLERLARGIPRLVVKVPLEDAHWTKLVKRDLGLFWMDDPDHRREYTPELLEDQLVKAGWRPTQLVRGYDLRATAISTLCEAEPEPAPEGRAR